MNNPQPRPQAKLDRLSNASTISLLLVTLSGLLVSFYAVLVGSLTAHSNISDTLRQAALEAAQHLSSVSVSDPVFGTVGLCDMDVTSGFNTRHVRSLNSLYATLREDHYIASDLGCSYIGTLVEKDLERVREIDKSLRAAIEQAADCGEAVVHRQGSMYERARTLTGQVRGQKLIAFRLRLGRARSEFASGIPAVGWLDANFVKQGMYKCGADVPITGWQSAQFYPLAEQTQICDGVNFQTSTDAVAPSMVLIEATYEDMSAGEKSPVIRTISACAIVGGLPKEQAPSVLLLSAPHGLPPCARTLKDLLLTLSPGKGLWRLAVNGAVPGGGHLAPATAPLPEPDDERVPQALQTAFYHFLRGLGPIVNVAQCKQLLEQNLAAPRQALAPVLEPNSALTRDTGAREFAFDKQTAPADLCQQILRAAFSGAPAQTNFPPSAIPLLVDDQGRCNLAGRRGFNRPLFEAFLDALYMTNFASIESAQIAKAVSQLSQSAIKDTETGLSLAQEELNSVAVRLEHPEPKENQAAQVAQLDRLKYQQKVLSAKLLKLKDDDKRYKLVKQRADTVLANAQKSSRITYELCAGMARLASKGIFITKAPSGFLLADSLLFRPLDKPVSEAEIYQGAEGKSAIDTAWADANLPITQGASSDTVVEDHPFAQLHNLQTACQFQPRFISFDSRQLTQPGSATAAITSESNYGASGIADGCRAFYAGSALRSGNDPEVGWSVLIRDLTWKKTDSDSHFTAIGGFPGANQQFATSRPALAVEVQIRSPVPILPNLPVGSNLTDMATGDHVSEVPPTPASML